MSETIIKIEEYELPLEVAEYIGELEWEISALKEENSKLRAALGKIALMTCCDYNENEYMVSVRGVAREALQQGARNNE